MKQETRQGGIDYEWISENAESAAQVLRMDFQAFILVFHRYVYFTDFIIKPFHKLLIKKLEDIVFGKNTKRNLYIGMPPRMGKTEITSYFIAWSYAVNPACNFIATSYSDELARTISDKVQKIIQSELFQKLFGIKMSAANASKDLWQIAGGGKFRAAPLKGGITGFGAGTMEDGYGGAFVLDDYLNPTNAYSDALRNESIKVYNNSLKSRRNKPNTPFIVIAQRLHKDDLIGYIIENESDDWDFLIVPALDEKRRISIWEERLPVEMLEKLRKTDEYVFYAQYQQQPKAVGGNLIKSDWFKYYDPDAPIRYQRAFITADTASKKNTWNDYTAIGLWALEEQSKQIHLIDLIHAKLESDELETSMKMMIDKYAAGVGANKRRISAIYIEDKASGTSLIQHLRRRCRVPVIPIKVVNDKLTRVMNSINYISDGRVCFPRSPMHPISGRMLNEIVQFSADMSHKHDDLVDMMIYAVEYGLAKRGII